MSDESDPMSDLDYRMGNLAASKSATTAKPQSPFVLVRHKLVIGRERVIDTRVDSVPTDDSQWDIVGRVDGPARFVGGITQQDIHETMPPRDAFGG